MNEGILLSDLVRLTLLQVDNSKKIGLNMKAARERKKMSQQDLANKLCCHWVTVSKLERARLRMSADWLLRLCSALDVKPAEILYAPLRETKMQRICRALDEWRHSDTENPDSFLSQLEAGGLMIVEVELTH